MSQNRRPSPVQPPLVTNPTNSMAQVQRPPEFPAPNHMNRPPNDRSMSSHLPSINAVQEDGTPNHERIKLPPIQLPPISNTRPQPSSDVFSINSLLSRNPDPPSHRPPQQRTSPPQPYSSFSPMARSLPDSHIGPRTHAPAPMPESRRYEDQTMAYRQPPPFVQMQQHQPQPQQMRFGTAVLEEQPHHSPANSVYSHGRGPYSSSTEPSPIVSAPPPIAFPPRQQRPSQPPPLEYTLVIRQQPVAARACGFGERDRRVIDPPPILELKITDRATGAPEQDPNAMLALHCTLLSHDGKEDETEVPPTEKGMPTTRRLMGTLVASPYQAKDEHGAPGTFFVFPDLSCRSPGKCRLRFKLLRVDPTMMTPGAVHGSVAAIVTDIFSVFTAKDFPGMRASSGLLKALRRQGLNVGVKKGSEARKGRAKAKKEDSSDDDDEDNSDVEEGRRGSSGSMETESTADVSPRSKPKKKGKRRKRDV